MICRVSSKGQKDNSSSEAQNREAEMYAKDLGLAIMERVFEVASGTTDNLEKRERYQEALNMCVSNNWDLLVSNADRLCRNMNQAVIEVLNKGIRIWEADSGLDRPLTEVEIQKKITEAQAEAQKIKSRTHKAIANRIQNGKPHGRKVAFRTAEGGIKAAETKRKRVVNNENNKKAVKIAKELREQGSTYSDIAKHLNENGYKPRAVAIETKKFREAYGIKFSTKEMRNKLHKGEITLRDWEKHQQDIKDCQKKEIAKRERGGLFTAYTIRHLVLYFDRNAIVSNRLVVTENTLYISGRTLETHEAKRILFDTSISLHKAAKQLNDLGIKAERGGEFYPNTIKQIRAKLIPPQA